VTSRALVAAAVLAGVALAPAARATDELVPIFSLSERTEDGKLVSYPHSSVVDVDVNSSVRLELSRPALAALSRGQLLASEERAAVTKQLKDLAAIQKELNAAARAVLDAVRARAEAQGAALAGDALGRYRAAHKQLLKATKRLDDYLGEARAEELVATALEAGEDQPTAALRFLAEEQRRLQARVQEDLEDVPGRVLTITAEIGDPPRQLHIPGYDDLKAGPARTIDKTRFTFDEQFAEEYAAAQALAREAGSWDRLRAAAIAAVQKKLTEIQAKLGTLATEVQALAVQAAREAAPEVKAVAAELEKAGQRLKAAHDLAAPALQAAIKPPPGADPAALLSAVVTALQQAAPEVVRAAEILEDAAPRLQRASASVAASGTRLLNQVAELATRTLGSIFVASKPAMAAPAPSATQVRLAAAHDAELSLLVADRKDGDIVKLTARVFDTGPDGEIPVPGGETTRYLRVRSRSVVADTGAVVLFTRPLTREPGPFVPGAGAFAVLRFKGYRDPGQANSNFWYYTAPGLGISAIAIPRAADGSTQLAWMGTFHLFGDVLQAALGTTTDAVPVWGFGLGLHRIAGIGKYFQ
jgi:hypothetical protein